MNKVAINLLWMVPGKVGGSETYLARLLSGLAERSSEIDYTLFALEDFAKAHPNLAKTFKTAYAPVRGRMKSFRVFGENSWLAAQCKVRNIDLVHHAGGTVPVAPTPRPIVTLHDLQYLYYPEYFTRTKLTFLKMMVPRSAEGSRLVLTPSEFTRRTVIERLGIDPSIVRVVPHGISPRESKESSDEIRNHYGLDGPFFIYPAITYPHKNHLVLIEAFAKLLKVHPTALLVLTGAKGSVEVSIAAEIRELGIDDSVIRLGYVPSDHLDSLYNEAAALVFPSRFEGFGAPVLEAMSRGCPVIAADATALPEVVADAGRLVSPDNPDDWAVAMADILEDDSMRTELAKRGLERARSFTWTSAADILEDAYRDVLETTL
ncbi:MAG TPA: glycosyltransferase family 1 protein [Actinomycetota bacterium]|nr:glycosyltransferase family 1 protein [Actinomycetota bacterium]